MTVTGPRRPTLYLVGTTLIALIAMLAAPASSDGDKRDAALSEVPAAETPAVLSGSVDAIAVVGDVVVIGGTFEGIADPRTGDEHERQFLAAFDRQTGRVLDRFHPELDGPVTALAKAPGGESVYVGGRFTTVDDERAEYVTRIDVESGERTTGFRPPRIDGAVRALAARDGVLYLGGQFKHVGGVEHRGVVALNGNSGDATSRVRFGVSGTLGGLHGRPKGRTKVVAMDISPDGERMLVAGNFAQVDGLERPQLAQLRLGRPSRVMDWSTRRYRARCGRAWDTYMRDVAYAPNGRYFVVAATGGGHRGTLCDAVARFGSNGAGGQRPDWVNVTGGDTLLSAAVSRSAVYVGGHQRWMNNPSAKGRAGPGAVPRPSLAALDPRTGMPLSWNPGRNPRGYGIGALLLTDAGLWVGSDTAWMGNRRYLRPRIAFLPAAGGASLPSEHRADLPGTVYQLRAGSDGDARATAVKFTGKRTKAVADVDIDGLGQVAHMRAGFVVGGTFYYALRDGTLHTRKFRSGNVGPAHRLKPYNDPQWSQVSTGSGQTFRGQDSGLRADLREATGMFYADGRLYYTLRGQAKLYWRPFSLDSGVSHPKRRVAASSIGWRHARGMFRAGEYLYFSRGGDGELMRVRFADGAVRGKRQRLDDARAHGVRWDSRINVAYGNRLPQH